MAAPPLQQPQAPAITGRRSTGVKSRAFVASLAAAPDEAQQHHEQQGRASAGASCSPTASSQALAPLPMSLKLSPKAVGSKAS